MQLLLSGEGEDAASVNLSPAHAMAPVTCQFHREVASTLGADSDPSSRAHPARLCPPILRPSPLKATLAWLRNAQKHKLLIKMQHRAVWVLFLHYW